MEAPDQDLPATWAVAAVRDVGSLRMGRQRSPDRFTGRFSTPYLRAANVTASGLDLSDVKEMDFTPEEREVFRLRRDDIVVTEASGSADHVGRPAIWNDELALCCFQNHLIRFRPHAVVPRYALLAFQHFVASGAVARVARGVGILHLGLERFGGMQFPVPPFREQERIATAADRRLAELEEAERALERALPHSAEQVREVLRAAATGAFSEVAPDAHAGQTPSERMRPERGEDRAAEPQGMSPPPWTLPPTWRWTRVDEAGSVQLGKMLDPRSHRGPRMRPYLRVANVQEDRLDLHDLHEMNFTEDEEERYRLAHGDILLNEGQSPELVGRPAMFRGEREELYFQKTLLRFRSGPEVDPEFALLVFRAYLHEGQFRRASRASTNIAHLSRRRFAAMSFPIAPLSEQRHLVDLARERLNALERQRHTIVRSLDKTAEMRTELLLASVTGALVPQDPDDEPAAKMLERIGPPPGDKPPKRSRRPRSGRDSLNMRRDHHVTPRTSAAIRNVLARTALPVPLPDLFRDAGFDPDEPADVEQFYLLLREAVGVRLRVASSATENASLEGADDAA
jgi:restriction endonuclease S subunit